MSKYFPNGKVLFFGAPRVVKNVQSRNITQDLKFHHNKMARKQFFPFQKKASHGTNPSKILTTHESFHLLNTQNAYCSLKTPSPSNETVQLNPSRTPFVKYVFRTHRMKTFTLKYRRRYPVRGVALPLQRDLGIL